MQAAINAEVFEFYEESRKYPRIKTVIPVQFTTEAGQSIQANIYDVSADSIQMRCERETALKINPAGMQLNKSDDKKVNVIFELSIKNEQKEISISCKVYYVAIVPDEASELFAIGLNFKNLEGLTVKDIERYIVEELEQSMESFN